MYPRRSVTVVTAPAAEPVMLAEAKNWAKIDITDEDPLIAALITAAVESAELYTKRSFINRTLKLTLDTPVCRWVNNLPEGVYDLPISAVSGPLPITIQLPGGVASSITSILTYDLTGTSSTFDTSNYWLDSASGRLSLQYGKIWPSNLRPQSACEITYVSGYGATSSSVPMPIKTAILMHVQSMYDERGQCDTQIPARCKQLLNQFIVYGL
jgi:uncharacterized phiE125 gp8 family phage protein